MTRRPTACPVCGATFTRHPGGGRAKLYCTPLCKARAWNQKHRGRRGTPGTGAPRRTPAPPTTDAYELDDVRASGVALLQLSTVRDGLQRALELITRH